MKRWSVLVSFVLFIALCISVTYWAIKLFKPSARPVGAPPASTHIEINMAAAAALFGGRPASAAAASNFQLKGVVVADNADESVAILTMDGKAAQSVAANAEVMPGVTVKEVHAKYVLLSDGGVTKRVELPEGSQQLRLDPVSRDSAAPPPPPPPPTAAATSTLTVPTTTQPSAQPSAPPATQPNGLNGPNGSTMPPPRGPGG